MQAEKFVGVDFNFQVISILTDMGLEEKWEGGAQERSLVPNQYSTLE